MLLILDNLLMFLIESPDVEFSITENVAWKEALLLLL